MNKVVFITGVSGFLGKYCAREFFNNGYFVVGICRTSMPHPENWGIDELIVGEITTSTLNHISDIYGLPDSIIHCAGSASVAYSIENPHDDFYSNVLTTLEILEFSRLKNGTVKIIIPSSAAVYGKVQTIPISEDIILNPISPYGTHKKIVEELVKSYGIHYDIPSICIRFFSLYGIGLQKQLLWDACNKALKGNFNFYGTGGEVRDWLHITDAARLIAMSVHRATPEIPIVNGGTGIGLSIMEVLTIIGSQWDPPLSPTFTNKYRPGDPDHYIADISKITEWGFKPLIEIKTNLIEYVNWFKQEYCQ